MNRSLLNAFRALTLLSFSIAAFAEISFFGPGAHIWHARNSVAGATAFTITPSTTVSNAGAVIWEFSGIDTNAPLDSAAVLNSQPSSVVNDSTLKGRAHLITSAPGTYTAQWRQNRAGTYASSTAAFRAASTFSACDLNQDGRSDILDVQLASDMDLGMMSCLAPSGLCNAAFVGRIIASSLGQGCVLPVLNLSASTLDFGNVPSGASASQTVTLSVTGTGSTTISSATVAGSGFTISGLSLPLTLAVGQSANFNITFTPTFTGASSGTVTLVSDALNSTATLTLAGSGTTTTHSVSLSWTASTSTNVAGYNVYRGSVSGGPYTKLDSSLISGVSYIDYSVSGGQTYYYVATAVDNNGNESAFSSQVSATVPLP